MTNHFSLARFLLWIPPLLWYRIIWGFSAQTASASGKVSDGLLHRILIVLSPAYARSEADIQGAAVEVLSFVERKAAHMFLYFLSGACALCPEHPAPVCCRGSFLCRPGSPG